MTIRIEVKSTNLERRAVTQRSTGKQFTFDEQEAWAHTVDQQGTPHPYPQRIRITLPKGQADAYPVGDYTLHPASFYVGNYGDLAMAVRLVPVKAKG